ncbi:MAG: dissimilatory-type sulfite reductase subunit beta [Candidatus Hydrothermarchaeaceae archaeon]
MALAFDDMDFGPPDYKEMLPETLTKNYGKWKYHEMVKPGVFKNVSETGDAVYTVRTGAPKFIASVTVRELCDIADKYCEGSLKFTSKHSIDWIVPKEADVDNLIAEVEKMGMPVGGTGNAMHSIIQCTGWVHCHTPATDAPGIAKSISDKLFSYFQRDDLPARLNIAVSGCLNMCGAVHCSDIAILGMHRVPPPVDDEIVSKQCEVPSLIAACPTYAIKPKIIKEDDGTVRKSIIVDGEKCMYCGICYGLCPGVPLADAENDGVSLWVGGKISNTRNGPAFSRLAIPFIKNNPPRWPEVVDIVEKIVETWASDAKKDERMGEWISRIGWSAFFKRTGIEFTEKHIDDYIFSVRDMNVGARMRGSELK